MPSILPGPETDSEDELPPSWEERATSDGFVFYVNHRTETTQWTHPRTGKKKRVAGELPNKWEKRIEEDTGKVIFYDCQNKRTTYIDPRLAFATEETDTDIGEVRQRFDASSTAMQILHGRDLSGKVAVVTGANAGIGMETARSLALHGCEVVMACRNRKSTEELIQRITNEKAAAGKKCCFMEVDFTSMRSTKRFAETLKTAYKHIDMLILNAGVFGMEHTLTEDNLETTFQVNHLAQFYLTVNCEELLDHTSRVVIVSSESHRMHNLPREVAEHQLSPPKHKYWQMRSYNNSKVCNVLFARELAKRWQPKGVCVYALHPGNMVNTGLSRYWWFWRFIFSVVRPFTKSLQQAAATTIYCATATELTGFTGLYYNNCFFCEPVASAQDPEMSENLWRVSEEIIQRLTEK